MSGRCDERKGISAKTGYKWRGKAVAPGLGRANPFIQSTTHFAGRVIALIPDEKRLNDDPTSRGLTEMQVKPLKQGIVVIATFALGTGTAPLNVQPVIPINFEQGPRNEIKGS